MSKFKEIIKIRVQQHLIMHILVHTRYLLKLTLIIFTHENMYT